MDFWYRISFIYFSADYNRCYFCNLLRDKRFYKAPEVMQNFKKFFFKELVFTISVGIIAFILFNTILKTYYLPIFWILLATIAILTGILHHSILQISEKETSKFTSRFMMVTGIKMMIYLVFITSFVFLYPSQAKIFLISFFILYLLYTIFEVVLIVLYLKKK